MAEQNTYQTRPIGKIGLIFPVLAGIGAVAFVSTAAGSHPERAWQPYLINFLLWSGIAQGGLLFSAMMVVTRARWTGRLAGIAEAFAAFFPISFALFLALFAGSTHIFPWLHEDLHGKELWLNLPFLFTRNAASLLLLYAAGFAYLYHARRLRRAGNDATNLLGRTRTFAYLYILLFALVLSLIGYDLVMAADPHWISTLFGPYTFVKAVYTGFGALIILAALIRMKEGDASSLTDSQFHDLGKLFFAFCLLWGDFFYVQLVVIWYGNISEETYYLIQRTLVSPWREMAWGVFIIGFVAPFLILLNRNIKTRPVPMIILCTIVIMTIWFEHLLLLAPALSHGATHLSLGAPDALITLGFFGLMASALTVYLNRFPEPSRPVEGGSNA